MVVKFINRTAAPMVVPRVVTSCACLTGELSVRAVPPHGDAMLRLRADFSGTPCFVGDADYEVALLGADDVPVGTITAKVTVAPAGELWPDMLPPNVCPTPAPAARR